MRAGAVTAIVAALAADARAEPFAARTGTSGVLDIADANALGLGALALAVELSNYRVPGKPPMVGPSPLSLGLGLGAGLEAGVGLREGGLPGDPQPSPLLFSSALKLRFFKQAGALPAVGMQLSMDRINLSPQGALDLLVTADLGTLVRASALIGAEQIHGLGSSALGRRTGGTLTVWGPGGASLVLEALHLPEGNLLGGALRWSLRGESAAVALGMQWQPSNDAVRLSLGFAFSSAPARWLRISVEEAPAPLELPKPEVTPPAPPTFRDPTPHLRLKVKGQGMPGEDANRHLQRGASDDAAPAAPHREPDNEGNR